MGSAPWCWLKVMGYPDGFPVYGCACMAKQFRLNIRAGSWIDQRRGLAGAHAAYTKTKKPPKRMA
jgi:hypothetical protein